MPDTQWSLFFNFCLQLSNIVHIWGNKLFRDPQTQFLKLVTTQTHNYDLKNPYIRKFCIKAMN